MPHITLNSSEPGIRGLLRFRPGDRPLSELAEVLLRGPGTLPRGERNSSPPMCRRSTTAATARLRTLPAPQSSYRKAWRWWSRSVLTLPTRRCQPS